MAASIIIQQAKDAVAARRGHTHSRGAGEQGGLAHYKPQCLSQVRSEARNAQGTGACRNAGGQRRKMIISGKDEEMQIMSDLKEFTVYLGHETHPQIAKIELPFSFK